MASQCDETFGPPMETLCVRHWVQILIVFENSLSFKILCFSLALSSQHSTPKQGHQEGGQGVTMTPGAMEFGGPWASKGPMSSKLAQRNFGENLFYFFVMRSHHNLDKTAAHNTGNATYFSWPRAHVWLSTPLHLM